MGKKLKQGGNGTVAETVASKAGEATNNKSTGRSGHTRARPVPASLEGRVRLRTGHLLTLYGVAHSTLYDRLRAGRIPEFSLPCPAGRDQSIELAGIERGVRFCAECNIPASYRAGCLTRRGTG